MFTINACLVATVYEYDTAQVCVMTVTYYVMMLHYAMQIAKHIAKYLMRRRKKQKARTAKSPPSYSSETEIMAIQQTVEISHGCCCCNKKTDLKMMRFSQGYINIKSVVKFESK